LPVVAKMSAGMALPPRESVAAKAASELTGMIVAARKAKTDKLRYE